MIARLANSVFRLCCWCLVLLLVLFSIYLVGGRLLAGSFASDQQKVEQFLRDNGLTFVALDSIESEWQVYDPQFTVKGLSYGESSEPALEIDELTVKLDSLRSFFYRVPVLEKVTAVGVRFKLRMDASGLWIEGIARGDWQANVDRILDLLPYLKLLQLEGVAIDFESFGAEFEITSRVGEPWVIVGTQSRKRLSMPIYLVRQSEQLGATGTSASLRGTYKGDIRDQDFSADVFFEAAGMKLDGIMGSWVEDKLISSALLDTRIWLSALDGEVDASADITVSDIHAGLSYGSVRILDSLVTQVRFHGRSITEGAVTVPFIEVKENDFSLELGPAHLAIDLHGDSKLVAASLDQINIEDANKLVSLATVKSLISERFGSAIEAVSPKGRVEDLRFIFDVTNSQPKLVGKVRDFSMESYLGVPAVDKINGLLSLQRESGYFDVDSDEFELYFANMFSEPWPFDSGRGRVGFSVNDLGVTVSSGLIELQQNGLEALGKLILRLPPERAEQTWGLTIGITDANLATAARYIPNTLSEDLSRWIDGAIGGGRGDQAGLTFHGALFRDAPAVRKSHDLYFKVSDTDIRYHPDWPEVTGVEATIHVNNDFVQSKGVRGRVFDSALTTADVFVPIPFGKQVDTVSVRGTAKGPFSDGIRVLNETPVADLTGSMAKEWSATGNMLATLDINVPIGPKNQEAVAVTVDVNVTGSALELPDFDLSVSNLSGTFQYNNERGLSSPGLTGEIFKYPVVGTIASAVAGDSGEILLTLDGRVDARSVYQWSNQVLLSRAEGVFDYRAKLHVPYGSEKDEVFIEARSDLVGVTLDLPAPLSKPNPESRHDFYYRQLFSESNYRVDMNLDGRITASLKIEDGIVAGGRLHFGEEPVGAIAYDGIRITGGLPELNFASWLETTETLGELSDVSLEDEIASSVSSVQLAIDRFDVYSLLLEEVDVLVTRNEAGWVAHLDSNTLRGQVRVEDDDTLPLIVSLDRLSFEEEESSNDPLADVDPSEIGNVDFETRQLLIAGEDYGAWSFKYRELSDGARFEDLTATTMGVRILEGAKAEWVSTPDGFQSGFRGEIQIDDLSETLTRFGLASSIEGEGLKLTVDSTWHGSPAMVDFLKLDGLVTIHEGKGRFVQADTGGALNFLGVFDFASLARRFRLDFADVLEKGLEFTDINGSALINQGFLEVKDPIVITGTSGRFTLGGVIDMNAGTMDNDLVVTLPVGRTLPWYAAYSAIATGPLAGAGVIIAQRVFANQINLMSSAKYKISGTLEAPDIEFVSIFSDEVREAGEADDSVDRNAGENDDNGESTVDIVRKAPEDSE
ncbi:MAG: hypothetical protein ACI8Z1_003011 [Candidatus Azotimanducaceae bacterium]